MNPIITKTQQIKLQVNNGCLLDEITNRGDYDAKYSWGTANR
jgi:hypothetical protein